MGFWDKLSKLHEMKRSRDTWSRKTKSTGDWLKPAKVIRLKRSEKGAPVLISLSGIDWCSLYCAATTFYTRGLHSLHLMQK
jgi:hypothetical protein